MTRTIRMEMNRVEGDLELEVTVDGNVITDARCIGTMYRGFEQLLCGRAATDALVIAPRICGICSTPQLYAAAAALEMAGGVPVAPNGTRIRNLCLMAESVMSDARHTFLLFAPDLCNDAYSGHPLYPRLMDAFAPVFQGRLARAAVLHSKQILGIVIAFGGQWPHSTYMLPGGVTAPLTRDKLAECRTIVDAYAAFVERDVLGCSIDRWLALQSADEFFAWLDESPTHESSAVGLFTQFARSIGLHQTGKGSSHLLSFGSYVDPESWQPPFTDRRCLMRAGFYDGTRGTLEDFDQTQIEEHVAHSWYADYGGGRHPLRGETRPDKNEAGAGYSFGKAPRYKDHVVQVGPLADLVIGGDPLIGSLFAKEGASTWLRQLTRFHRPVLLLRAMRALIDELVRHVDEPTHEKCELPPDGQGHGLINAARGSLGHWLDMKDGKIANYQVITPTTWNASPRDSAGRRGHWEESFIGLEVVNLENPVELSHLVRSHDACLVCTVHFARTGRKQTFQLG